MFKECDDRLTGNIYPLTQQILLIIAIGRYENGHLNGENGDEGRHCEISAQTAARQLSGPLLERAL